MASCASFVSKHAAFFILTTVIFVWPCSCDLSPGNDFVERLINKFDNNGELLEEFLAKKLRNFIQMHGGTPSRHIWNSPAVPHNCDVCQLLVHTMNFAASAGLQYPDLRDTVIMICNEIVSLVDQRAVIVCPGICDLYGPHVMKIAHTKTLNETETCLLFNHCHPEDFHMNIAQVWPETEFLTRFSKLTAPVKDLLSRKMGKTKGHTKTQDKTELLHILHFTDAHIDLQYAEGSATECGLPVCCRRYWPGSGSAWKYGTYGCNLPPASFEVMIDYVSKLTPKVDFVLYSGDTAPSTMWNETLDTQTDGNRYVAKVIASKLPGIPAYSCFGNHDALPTNLLYYNNKESASVKRAFIDTWKDLSTLTPENEMTFQHTGCYEKKIMPGLRLVAYNTNYGTGDNFYNILSKDEKHYKDMWIFLEGVLTLAQRNNEKVILLGHHPTGTREMIEPYSHKLKNLELKFSQIIVVHLLGHEHIGGFKLVRTATGKATSLQFYGTSANTRDIINPSIRIVSLDKETFEVQDIVEHSLNITNKVGDPPKLQKLYSFREEYKMADLSPTSWQTLIDSMVENDNIFNRYWANRAGRAIDEPCDEECKHKEICGMKEVTYHKYRECVAQPLE